MQKDNIITCLVITRYLKWGGFAGLLSMVCFRIAFWFHKHRFFYKLLGTGRNGSFDIQPDWKQWGILFNLQEKPSGPPASTTEVLSLLPGLVRKWYRFWRCNTTIFVLQPIEGHGKWDGKAVFGDLPYKSDYDGELAILTRATIRLSKLRSFWKAVPPVAHTMNQLPGFQLSYGIGEIPFIKQATFSIWNNRDSMKAFAYRMQEHKDVIARTRTEKWYREDMFVRFRVISRFS